MRTEKIFGLAALALSLGIGGALAATPTFHFQARSTLDVKNLFPAQTGSSAPSLSSIANSKSSVSPKGFAAFSAATSNKNAAAGIANMRAAGVAMRFIPNERTANSRQGGLNALRQRTSARSKGLAGIKRAAGLPKATAPAVRRVAAAAAKTRSHDNAKRLSSLSAR